MYRQTRAILLTLGLLLGTASVLNATDLFHKVEYPLARGRGIATGVFTSSGNTDVAVCDPAYGGQFGTPAVNIFLGAGGGALLPPKSYPSGRVGCQQIKVADLNHDDKADLVILGRWGDDCQSEIDVLLGNGDGSFQPPQRYFLGQNTIASDFAVIDYDNDGNLDVLTLEVPYDTNSINSIFLLKGSPTGTLVGPTLIYQLTGLTGDLLSMFVADFNGDGKTDIAAVTSSPGVYVLLGNGDGTYAAPKLSPFSVPAGYETAAVGDVNGDGKLDIGLPADYGNRIVVLFGNGDGTFQAPVNFDAPGALANLVFADFNGDGRLDFAASGYDNTPQTGLSVFYQQADGFFVQGPVLSNSAPYLAVADLNGDSSPDLIVTSQIGGVTVFLSDTGPTGITMSPGFVTFSGDVASGTSVQSVFITNPGDAPLVISGITVDPEFFETDSCVGSLSKGQACLVTVSFSPARAGVFTGSLLVSDNTGVGKEVIPMVATIAAPLLTFSPPFLTFADQKIGTASVPQTMIITNISSAPLYIGFDGFLGTGSFNTFLEYTTCLTNNQSVLVSPGGSCELVVAFTPQSPGTVTAPLAVIAYDAAYTKLAQYEVVITGTGYVSGAIVQLNPASLTFPNQFAGTSSAPLSVLLKNVGDLPASISSVSATTDFAALNTCGSSVAPGASCSIGAFFSPGSSGSKSGTLTVVATDSSHTVSLSGTGSDIAVTAATGSATTQTVVAGENTSYSLSLTPQSFSGTITLACTGAPPGATCTVSSTTLTLSGTATITVNVTTTSRAVSSLHQRNLPHAPWRGLAFASFGLVGVIYSGKRARTGLLLIIVVAALLVSLSCGGGGSLPIPQTSSQINPSGTPSGTYTLGLTISAGASTVKTAPLTLNVF